MTPHISFAGTQTQALKKHPGITIMDQLNLAFHQQQLHHKGRTYPDELYLMRTAC